MLTTGGSVGIGTASPVYKLDIAGVTRTRDLIAHDITLSNSSANILQAFVGYSGYTNFSGGIGTGGSDSILSAKRLTSTGNLVNISRIQAGEVLLTTGGTFAAKVSYTIGTWPGVSFQFVAIGDLNGDGNQDVIALDINSTKVSVFLNNGDGTLASKVDYTVGAAPFAAAIGDLNGDGKADLAVANYNSGNVSVLLNNGTGTFAAWVDYVTNTTLRDVVVGDLNVYGK